MVVDGTGVAEQGRHRDLLAAEGAYHALHAAQFADGVGSSAAACLDDRLRRRRAGNADLVAREDVGPFGPDGLA